MMKLMRKRWKLHSQSLRSQLIIRSLLLLSAVLLVVGTLQYFFMRDFVYRNKAETLQAQLSALPPNLQLLTGEENNKNQPPRLSPLLQLIYQPDLLLSLIAKDGSSSTLSEHNELKPIILTHKQYQAAVEHLRDNKGIYYRTETDSSGSKQLLVFRPLGPPGETSFILQAGFQTSALDKILFVQLTVYAGISLIALLAATFIYTMTLIRALAPLSHIVTAAEKTDAGNLAVRLPIDQGQAEIDTLSSAFNNMLIRLDRSFMVEREITSQMRRFIADASHELRTPLTSIHGFIDVLQRGAARNPVQLQQALASMQEESVRINKLVEDLLLLAKLDQMPLRDLQPLSVPELLLKLESQLRMLASQRCITLQLPPAKFDAMSWTVQANEDQLKQVLLNIFLNAVQHTDETSGQIAILVTQDQDNLIISICDNGIGIQQEQLLHLFDRFYRGDSSRSRNNGGSGLGLAISKSIIEAHSGTLLAISPPSSIPAEAGSEFRICLPLQTPNQ